MKELLTEWRKFLAEASTEERVKALDTRMRKWDAEMRKKTYGAEDAEESQKPDDLKKAFINKEQRSIKVAGNDIRKYFALMVAPLAGHLSGRIPVGYDKPQNADDLLKQLNSALKSMARGLEKDTMIKFMKDAGLPTSLK